MSDSKVFSSKNCSERRFLHFTMKIADRLAATKFFCEQLGMKILRHEEMSSGCEVQCNGNFQVPWSKTMVGYGDEHSFFALELNFNYEVEGYRFGNDFSSLTIRNRRAFENFRQNSNETRCLTVLSPDGLKINLINEDVPSGDDPIEILSLNVSDLKKSADFYHRLLDMKIDEENSDENRVRLFFDSNLPVNNGKFRLDRQVRLELVSIGQKIDRGTGYGRKAFSCPTEQVDQIQKLMQQENQKLYFEIHELGDEIEANKVKVVILADPDGHEVPSIRFDSY